MLMSQPYGCPGRFSTSANPVCRNHLLRMVFLYSEGDGDGAHGMNDHTISITELKKSGKRYFQVTAENLKTGEVLNSPKDNAKILDIMPLEFWPAFVRQSLLVGPSDEQSVLFHMTEARDNARAEVERLTAAVESVRAAMQDEGCLDPWVGNYVRVTDLRDILDGAES